MVPVTLYDESFYELEGKVARAAAEVVIPWLVDEYPIHTAIDIGSGTGEWAFICRVYGMIVWTVDHLVPEDLLISPGLHIDQDLNESWQWHRTDLAICLEVAEHLEPSVAGNLVTNLARADYILFSAATPGQPGVGHINCRPHEYWHELFALEGFEPRHIGPTFDEPVADFYRRNLYLYERSWES